MRETWKPGRSNAGTSFTARCPKLWQVKILTVWLHYRYTRSSPFFPDFPVHDVCIFFCNLWRFYSKPEVQQPFPFFVSYMWFPHGTTGWAFQTNPFAAALPSCEYRESHQTMCKLVGNNIKPPHTYCQCAGSIPSAVLQRWCGSLAHKGEERAALTKTNHSGNSLSLRMHRECDLQPLSFSRLHRDVDLHLLRNESDLNCWIYTGLQYDLLNLTLRLRPWY